MKLKTKFTLLVSILVAIFALTAFFAFSDYKKSIQETIAHQQFLMISALADEIDSKLLTAQQDLIAVAKAAPPEIMQKPEKAQAFLDNRPILHKMFDNNVVLFTPSGKIFVESPYIPARRGFDMSFHEFITNTIKTNKPYISDPYVPTKPPKHPVVILTVPLCDSKGKITGILGGSFDLMSDNFLGRLSNVKIGETGYLYLIASDRTLIMHPDKKRILTNMAPGLNSLFDKAIGGFDGTDETTTSYGIRMLASSKHLKVKDWILLANFPQAEAYHPIHVAERYLFIVAFIGSIAAFISIFLITKYLIKPLELFTHHVTQLPKKTADDRFLSINTEDEIGTLCLAFNSMVTEIDTRSALAEQADFSQRILNSTDDHMAVLGPDGSILGVNAAWRRFAEENSSGNQSAWDIGSNYFIQYSEEWGDVTMASEAYEGIRKVQSRHLPNYKIEYPCHSPSEKRWFSMSVMPLQGKEGTVLVSHTNITERKQAEAKLIRINRLLAVLSHVNRAIAEANDRAKLFEDICRIAVERGNFRMAWIGLVNQDTGHVEVVSHFGYEEGYLSLIKITIESGDPGGRGPTGTAIRENRYIINNNTPENDYMVPWRDEAIKRGYLSSAAFPIREHKQVIGALTVYISEPDYFETDEIELAQEIVDSISFAVDSFDHKQRRKQAEEDGKRLEEQLHHAQKMESIGILAGGVAHDFNNILSAITGYGYMAQMMLKDDMTTQGYIKEMLDAANRAAELTKGLLAFSRKQVINPVLVDLNEIVRNIEKMLGRIIREDVKLSTMLSDEELPVLVDVGQIEQVLMNLATNARDAMPNGGQLVIQTYTVHMDSHFAETYFFQNADTYALLKVSDTGVGMDPGTKENIFEPFFTTKEVGKGTGLGLSMAYGIIKQHSGNIRVYSDVGKGTTFKIYLPLAKTNIEVSSELIQTLPRGKGETILIAEDEAHVRESMRLILQNNGFNTIEAENGQVAVIKYKENSGAVSLILLDVIMPVKNGREAYEEIKDIEPGVKMIFMSGYTDDVISRNGILEEGFDLISKPINPGTLLRKLRDVLDG